MLNMAYSREDLQDVVIIGGGIAGLATALALHRVGIKPMVLEQANKLETIGGAITTWANAWKALEVLGVANGLREKFCSLSSFKSYTPDGKLVSSFPVTRDMENIPLLRMTLLEALNELLPQETIHYGIEVVGIKQTNIGYTKIECKSGLKINTKVLVGCDGVRSIVAKWLGLKDAVHCGHTMIRGIATIPDDHKSYNLLKEIERTHMHIVGRGTRVGISWMSSNTCYWFVVFNTKGRRIDEPELIRKEALALVQGWRDPLIKDLILQTPLESLSRRDLGDRWTWPGVSPLYQGGVTLGGDALHPMTPYLAQGGCCALEDAVVLGRHLGRALIMSKQEGLDKCSEMEAIENALKTYIQERWPRTLALTIKAYLMGVVMLSENKVVSYLRGALWSKVMSSDSFTKHIYFDCGKL